MKTPHSEEDFTEWILVKLQTHDIYTIHYYMKRGNENSSNIFYINISYENCFRLWIYFPLTTGESSYLLFTYICYLYTIIYFEFEFDHHVTSLQDIINHSVFIEYLIDICVVI